MTWEPSRRSKRSRLAVSVRKRSHYPATDQDAERFGRLLVETWQGIPAAPRRAIVAHWRAGGGPDIAVVPWLDCYQAATGERSGDHYFGFRIAIGRPAAEMPCFTGRPGGCSNLGKIIR